jgi:hypothetical protein
MTSPDSISPIPAIDDGTSPPSTPAGGAEVPAEVPPPTGSAAGAADGSAATATTPKPADATKPATGSGTQ